MTGDPAAAGWSDVLGLSAVDVAPRLLGAVVRHRTADGVVAVRLTEVEAYAGQQDPASHAFRGPGRRNATMFGPPGRLYVYFTYGMHWCANVVCGPDGTAAAVLLRAGAVVDGLLLARSRRPSARRDVELARGPARLTLALGIDGSHDGAPVIRAEPGAARAGLPVLGAAGSGDRRHPGAAGGSPEPDDGNRGGAARGEADGGEPGRGDAGRGEVDRGVLTLELPRRRVPARSIRTGPRVGVRGPGGDGAVFPWRFWIDADPTVSVYRPGAPRRRRAAGEGIAPSP